MAGYGEHLSLFDVLGPFKFGSTTLLVLEDLYHVIYRHPNLGADIPVSSQPISYYCSVCPIAASLGGFH